jgi:hypothetical protein
MDRKALHQTTSAFVNRYIEFHLGRTITLFALSDLLTQIGVERFAGFVRVNDAGEGRFVLSFPRADGADVPLLTLIRENPSRLYAESSLAYLGDWVLDVFGAEIGKRTGAAVATEREPALHPPRASHARTCADWLLGDPNLERAARDIFARYAPAVPLPLRGVLA